MKILQVGVGAFGKNHLRVWRELGHDVYVTDLSVKALGICDVYGIPKERRSTDYHAFLNSVDAVDVVTPADVHCPIVMDAIEIRKPVFVEKPLAYSFQEARRIAESSNKSGISVQVGHLFRYNPAFETIMERIQTGDVGDIMFVNGKFSGFKRTRSDAGVLMTDGIHYIDLANIVFGKYPDHVYCSRRDNFGRGLEDLAYLILDYGAGVSNIEVGNIQPGKSRDFQVVGRKQTIIADLEGQRVEIIDARHEKVDDQHWKTVEGATQRPFLVNREPLKEELADFVFNIEKGKHPDMGAVKAANIVKIVETAYVSATEGRRVKFVPFEL